ncbi:hypothetical protein V3528_21625, partial [Acinetobacter johnsonii]
TFTGSANNGRLTSIRIHNFISDPRRIMPVKGTFAGCLTDHATMTGQAANRCTPENMENRAL